MNEKDLIAAISQGDRKAFESFYESTSGLVYNTSLSYVHNTTDAEEVTQQVYIKVFKYIQNFKGDSALKTWLYRIAINTFKASPSKPI